jgi:hypothetical protein
MCVIVTFDVCNGNFLLFKSVKKTKWVKSTPPPLKKKWNEMEKGIWDVLGESGTKKETKTEMRRRWLKRWKKNNFLDVPVQ